MEPQVRGEVDFLHRGAVPEVPLEGVRLEVLDQEREAPEQLEAGSRRPAEPRAAPARVDGHLQVDVARHPGTLERHVARQAAEEGAAPHPGPAEGTRHQDRIARLAVVVPGRFVEQLPVARAAVGARDQHLARRELARPLLEDEAKGRDDVLDVKVRDGGLATAAEEVPVPGGGEPRREEHEERGVLAPVGEERRETDDGRRERLLVLPHHRLADRLGSGVDVVAVGRAVLGEGGAGRGQPAGRDRAREDEALHAELAGEVERVPQALDVRPPVLGVLLAGEVVVCGEVDDGVGASEDADHPEDFGEGLALADVDLEPGDVRVHGRSATDLRPAGDPEDPVLPGEGLEQVPADESGCPREDERGESHRRLRSDEEERSVDPAGRVGSGFGGGPSFGRPSASNFPSWQGQE